MAGAQAIGLSLPATELTSGVSVTGVAARSALSAYGIRVTAASRIMFDLTGGTDPQIFLAKNRLATFTDYDLRVGFGFPSFNVQLEVGPGEYYLGVRDVNLDIPLPAEPFTLVAVIQDVTVTPPLGLDITGGVRRETSGEAGQVQYFTVAVPNTTTVVDLATGERFGSGNADVYVGENRYPQLAADGSVINYSFAATEPGNVESLRVVTPPAGKLVAALHGAAGFENVFLGAVTTAFDLVTLENNRGVKLSRTAPVHFRFTVPAGQTRLTLETAGGSGASQLSAKAFGPILSSSIFPGVVADWVGAEDPRKPNDSLIEILNPTAGDYYLLLTPETAAGFADVTVKARFRSN